METRRASSRTTRDAGSLAGWLRAVVSQLAVDQYRKQSKYVQIEETREFENLAEESSNHSGNDMVVHHGQSPEELFSEQQTGEDVSAALRTAIDSLEAEDKLILKLYYFDDLKLKDIAATFGYHEATASRKLVRIQTEVRKCVEKGIEKTPRLERRRGGKSISPTQRQSSASVLRRCWHC
jgi:RNA polymerase sigma factor (sigma-70 family)